MTGRVMEQCNGAVFCDSHAHLSDTAFDSDLADVLGRAREAGVGPIVNVGIDRPTSVKCLEQAAEHPEMYATAGLHPHDASAFSDSLIDFFDSIAADPKVVAIGETGLDYHYMRSPREMQIKSMLAHLDLAESVRLPVVLHCREAYPELAGILEQRSAAGTHVPWLLHCYAGSPADLERFIALDCYFSLGGMVTFRNYDGLEIVRSIPADRLILETDAPYLAPVPHRGRRCEPWMVTLTAERIAGMRGEGVEAFSGRCLDNSLNLFNLS